MSRKITYQHVKIWGKVAFPHPWGAVASTTCTWKSFLYRRGNAALLSLYTSINIFFHQDKYYISCIFALPATYVSCKLTALSTLVINYRLNSESVRINVQNTFIQGLEPIWNFEFNFNCFFSGLFISFFFFFFWKGWMNWMNILLSKKSIGISLSSLWLTAIGRSGRSLTWWTSQEKCFLAGSTLSAAILFDALPPSNLCY